MSEESTETQETKYAHDIDDINNKKGMDEGNDKESDEYIGQDIDLADFYVKIPKFLKIKRSHFETNSDNTIIHEPLFQFKHIIVAFNYYKASGKISFMLLDSGSDEHINFYTENLNSSLSSKDTRTLINLPIFNSVFDLPLEHGILFYFLEDLDRQNHGTGNLTHTLTQIGPDSEQICSVPSSWEARPEGLWSRTLCGTNNLATFLEQQEFVYSLPFEQRPYLIDLFIRCYSHMTFKLSSCKRFILCEPCDFEKNVGMQVPVSCYLTNISCLIHQKKKQQ